MRWTKRKYCPKEKANKKLFVIRKLFIFSYIDFCSHLIVLCYSSFLCNPSFKFFIYRKIKFKENYFLKSHYKKIYDKLCNEWCGSVGQCTKSLYYTFSLIEKGSISIQKCSLSNTCSD